MNRIFARRAVLALTLTTAALSTAACSSSGRSGGSGGTGGSSGYADPDALAFRPVASKDLLYVWSGGIDALLVDPKDAGLRDALHAANARIFELPDEMGEPEFPADAIELALAEFLGPMSLRVTPTNGDEAGPIPVRVQMHLRNASPEEARRRADQLTRVLSKYDVPSLGVDEADGLSKLDFGMVQAQHGIARTGRADTLVVAMNGLDTTELDLGTLDLPAGVAPAAAFRFDYASLADMIERFAGPEAVEPLRAAGMGDVVMQGGIGHGQDRVYMSLRTLDWARMAQASHALPHGSIERAAFAAIPSDATAAMITRMDLRSILHALEQATQAGEDMSGMGAGLDPLAMAREITGIDLDRDLVAHLGETVGLYMSDATGGGGYFSAVAFVRVADEPALRSSLERLEGRLEDLAADQGFNGLTMRHSQHAGAEVTTVTVSGWPVPIEPSWAIRDGWLYASASAQGLRAALDQAASPKSDLFDNADFRAEFAGSSADLLSVTFVDVPRFARAGYPLAAMMGAAISNGVNSAGQPDRAPIGIVPGFAEFARGARATVLLGRIDGDDMVIRGSGDRSLLVQASGIVGAMGPLPVMLLGAAFAGSEQSEPAIEEVFEGMEDPSMDDTDAMQNDTEDMDAPPATDDVPVPTPADQEPK